MPEIEVAPGTPGAYRVTVGEGLLDKLSIPERRSALIYPSDLPPQFREAVIRALSPAVTLAVPPRDGAKTLAVYAEALSQLAAAGLPRDSAVVGLGGGAVTDLAGFVAASYLRGVAYYALPTTLLGMVDAAVGGKTGLNLPEGKNLVGAFWPPRAVWCDVAVLETLPDAVFREGAAEAYKHGLIADPSLLERVLSPEFRPGGEGLTGTIADAIAVKAGVVTRDLTEQGERAFLNFGHTLAHALEASTGGELAHGEAVGYGMHYAALLSRALGGDDLSGLTRNFLRWQRPQPLPPLDFGRLWTFMTRDKKADSEGLRFVLLRGLAQPYLARVAPEVLEREFAQWSREVDSLGLGSVP